MNDNVFKLAPQQSRVMYFDTLAQAQAFKDAVAQAPIETISKETFEFAFHGRTEE